MSQTPLKAEVDLTVMCKYSLIVCNATSALGREDRASERERNE